MKADTAMALVGKICGAWREYPVERRALGRFPPGPPILVTGAHRSGTTWVGAMLAVPGLWCIHEPFNTEKGLWNEHFTYLRPSDTHVAVDRLMNRLLSGKCRRALNMAGTEHRLMPLRLLRTGFNRVLIKDPLACLMSDYLTVHHKLRTLVLFRHPAAFVASIHRLKWPSAVVVRQFLECEPLMNDWLSPRRQVMEANCRSDTIESAATLHGCIYAVLWGFVERNRAMRMLVFEDLCRRPIEAFEALFAELGLHYDSHVREMHEQNCFADAPGDYRTHEIRRKSIDMADRWRLDLDAEACRKIRQVWESFDIPMYRDPASW